MGVAAIVSPEKVREVPELEIPEPTALMVIVPLEGLKVAVEELVKVPAMLNEEEVVTVAPEAMVKLWKVRVPELVMEEPLFMVMVPFEGEKLPPLTFKAPLMENELEVVVVPVTVMP